MANPVRLDKLCALARLYSDQRPGGANAFIPDDGGVSGAGLYDLANLAIAEEYDILVRAGGEEYHSTSSNIAVVAGTSLYSLPASFYQFLSFTLAWSADNHEEVPRISTPRQRIDLLNGQLWSERYRKGCRLQGTQLELLPTPTSNVTGTLYYIPTCPRLSTPDATFDGVNGWEKMVALRMAIEMRTIEEAPYGDLEGLYEREKRRIESLASEREAAHPAQVVDVDPDGSGFPLTRATRWWP